MRNYSQKFVYYFASFVKEKHDFLSNLLEAGARKDEEDTAIFWGRFLRSPLTNYSLFHYINSTHLKASSSLFSAKDRKEDVTAFVEKRKPTLGE